MRQDTRNWGEIYAAFARAQEVRLTVQHTRWQAARARYTAQLLRLASHMCGANRLTLWVTEEILKQRGLLTYSPLRMRASADNGRHPPP
jgi:hypothetical protein